MGQLLSQPITEKNITFVQHDHISHSIGEMQGYRVSMEDAYCDVNDTIAIKIKDAKIMEYFRKEREKELKAHEQQTRPSTKLSPISSLRRHKESEHLSVARLKDELHSNYVKKRIKYNIYGVFDGHGGSSTSKYMSEHLPIILRRWLKRAINHLDDNQKFQLLKSENVLELIDFPKLLKNTYLQLDSMYYRCQNNSSGSTGVVALLFQGYIIVANVGDSRCVLCANGASKDMSLDHKPKHLGELMRVHNDGGYVAANRVNSILALSRAFGDYAFKMLNSRNRGRFAMIRSNRNVTLTPPEEYQVTAEPDIFIHKMLVADEFLILACDGVWDCYRSKDLVKVIRHQLSLGKRLSDINALVLDNCIGMANTITGIGFDNMTLIIIALHQNLNGLDDWYMNIKNKILDEKFGKLGH